MKSSNKQLETSDKDNFKKQETIKFTSYIKEGLDENFDLLKDFCVASKLDRDLLLGVFEDHNELQKVVKGLSDNTYENLQRKTYASIPQRVVKSKFESFLHGKAASS